MKVRALEKFEKIEDSDVKRTRKTGEEWEVTKERADILIKKGLVEIVEDTKDEETIRELKPKKKTSKKGK